MKSSAAMADPYGEVQRCPSRAFGLAICAATCAAGRLIQQPQVEPSEADALHLLCRIMRLESSKHLWLHRTTSFFFYQACQSALCFRCTSCPVSEKSKCDRQLQPHIVPSNKIICTCIKTSIHISFFSSVHMHANQPFCCCTRYG